MSKSKVYTKTGDGGETSILSGERVKKYDSRISVYGDIDELNSFVGVVCSFADEKHFSYLVEDLRTIQSELFNIGAVISCPQEKRKQFGLKMTEQKDIEWLEGHIDEYNGKLPELKNFILPGGTKAASFIHVCRTICRRAERECVYYNLELKGDIPDPIIKYLNRLSDYFFVLARYVVLESGGQEILWKKD